MPAEFTGGCACGAIRYQVSAEPLSMVNCHCRDCQRATGGAYAPVVVVPTVALAITRGELRHHEVTAESGNRVRRGFCADCGSPVLSRFDPDPGYVAVKAGSLDDPGWFAPTADIWTTSAQPWDSMDAQRKKLERGPRRSSR